MDVTEENMTPQEMHEKVAELEYRLSQERDLLGNMRHWLDVADEDMAVVRSENDALRKQIKDLEKIISVVQQDEAEPCSSLLADDLSAKRCSEKMIQKLEKESTMMQEQNTKLTAEIKSLQQERDRDKVSLRKFSEASRTLKCDMEEARLELQNRDEEIHQKNLRLKYLEETVEEFSNTIKDLRLTKQELREQLEDRQNKGSLAVVNSLMVKREGSLTPPLSFAEEIKLLTSSAEVRPDLSDSTDLQHEETEAEELLKPQSLTVDLQTKRCADVFKTAVHRARLFLLFVVILTVLAAMASGSFKGNFFSTNSLWSGARLIFQPYVRVQYGALPPI